MKISQKATVLVIDDETFYIDIIGELLADDYKVIVAKNGQQGLTRAQKEQPDLILLDWLMPDIDGLEVCKQLKNHDRTKDIPVIFLTVKAEIEDEIKGFESGAIDYIRKPMSPPVVKARVKTYIDLKLTQEALNNQNYLLEEKVTQRTEELEQTKDVAINCLASLAETRDNETGFHIRRTQHYVKALAEQLAKNKKFSKVLDKDMIEMMFKSAPLHDIGKVGVKDQILLKPGLLNDEEWQEMKQHATHGVNALERAEALYGTTDFLKVAKEISANHHEKWDGTGYPKGLSGENIPLSGRIMAVADVYDALISKRVYKEAYSHEKSVKIILEMNEEYFDPTIIDAFIEIKDTFAEIAEKFNDKNKELIRL